MPINGKTDALASVPKYLGIGRILAVAVTAGGSAYTNNAAAVVTPSGGGGSGFTATALVTGGIVQTVTVTNPGTGYTSAPTLTVPGGTGATFSVKIEPVNYVASTIVFVDDTEAALATNKSKGIHSPGWWSVVESQLSDGSTRYKAELLITLTGVTTGTGDKEEDLIVPDVESVASISVQPTNQTTVSGAATFSVTAAITGGGSITYQWQLAPAVNPTRFANVGGATSASLVLAGKTIANTGDKYRVIVGGGGTKKLNSNAVTLTFGT